MRRGRVLGLDIGQKRTGIAVSDEERILATPHRVISATQKKDWLMQIQRVIQQQQPVEIVVGLPLEQSGAKGRDAENVRQYIALLKEAVSIPVIEWDRALLEANVSKEHRKEINDKVAAAWILQAYLDTTSK